MASAASQPLCLPLLSLPLFRGPFEDGPRDALSWPALSPVSLYFEPPHETHFPRPPKFATGDPERGQESLGPAGPGLGWHLPLSPSHPAGIKAASSGSREMPLPIAPPVSKQPGPLAAFEARSFGPEECRTFHFRSGLRFPALLVFANLKQMPSFSSRQAGQ